MKKLFPLALLVVAAGVVVVLTPMSARAQMAFPLYVSNNSGAFGNTIEQFGSGAASSPFASTGLSGPEGLWPLTVRAIRKSSINRTSEPRPTNVRRSAKNP